jgi:hypothetical protein
MQIETYEVAETANNMDDCAEVRDLIESLGLDGQKELISPKGAVFPYRKMFAEEESVYSRLMPQKTKPANYASGAIPLRVLQVLAHAQGLDFFTHFEIWHPEDVRKDPILVGCKGSEWRPDRYILARWGEALESFDILRAKALEIAKDEVRAKAVIAKRKAEEILETVEHWSPKMIFDAQPQLCGLPSGI